MQDANEMKCLLFELVEEGNFPLKNFPLEPRLTRLLCFYVLCSIPIRFTHNPLARFTIAETRKKEKFRYLS